MNNNSNKLPKWATDLLALGAIAGLIYIDSKTGGPQARAREQQIKDYTEQAEQEVNELLSMNYDDAIAILRDTITDMDRAYWKFFEAKLSSVATTLRARNLLSKAQDIWRSRD